LIRAVLDPGVIIAGILSRTAAPAELLRWWDQGAFDLIVSRTLIDEIRRVLAYPKIRRRVTAEEARDLLEMFNLMAVWGDDADEVPAVCRDPADDYLFALAAMSADVLISGDKDVLEATDPPARVLTPAGFAEILRRRSN
jgi:putative PIN family toxin of toxin-antitoxin system